MDTAHATLRLASLTSILRTRKEDGVRRLVHGGSPAELVARGEALVLRLERAVDRLEKLVK